MNPTTITTLLPPGPLSITAAHCYLAPVIGTDERAAEQIASAIELAAERGDLLRLCGGYAIAKVEQ